VRDLVGEDAVGVAVRVGADRLGAVPVAPVAGEQRQVPGRGARVAVTHPVLLRGDDGGGGLADGQPPAGPVVLGVGIDQHRAARRIAFQAVPWQHADLIGAAAGIDEQFGDPPLGHAAPLLEHAQVLSDHFQHRVGQAARPGLPVGVFGDVAAAQDKGGGKACGDFSRGGHPQGVHVVEEPEDTAGQPQPGIGGHLCGPHLVREPVGERDDVLAAERDGVVPAVVARHAQAERQHFGRADGVPGGVGGRPAAAQGKVLGRPPLDGLAQPPLANAGEVQLAGQPEHTKLPDVLGPLLLRPGQQAVQLRRQPPQQLAGIRADFRAGDLGQVQHAARLPGMQQLDQATSRGGQGPQPGVGAPLQPGQQLCDHAVGQAAQDDLVPGHVRRGSMPRPLRQDRAAVIAAMPAPRDAVSAAHSGAVRRRCRARRHDAGPERGQRPDLRPGQPRLGRQPRMPLALRGVGGAQPLIRLTRARAASHPARPVPAGPAAAGAAKEVLPCQLADLPPRAARHAQVRPPVRGGGGAAGHRAFPQAEQRVTAHRGKDLRHGIPARPGQEVRPQHAPQNGQLIAGHRVRGGNRSQLRGHRRTS